MTFETSPRERAAWSLRTAIRRLAHELFGSALVEIPIEGMTLVSRPGLDDPLAGVRAAVLARDVAVAEMRAYAQEARAAGRSWDDVAEALGIEPADDGESRAETAYLLLVEQRPLPSNNPSRYRPSARWACANCGQWITDRGPFGAHPDDREEGHAPGCPRRAAELADYRFEWDDE